MAAAFDRYLELIPKNILRWALLGSNSTSILPFATTTVVRAKTMLKKVDAYLWLGSDEEPETGEPSKTKPHAPAYMFLAKRDDEDPSVLEMRFASDFVWQKGVEAIVAFAIDTTRMLPVVSGRGGLSLA